uniref:MULE transposase domain-containing protein n=1 Tax=Fagus sylvatica TaxID=28930 RepID=A0A2N9G5E1_FAGSY
MFNMQIWMVMEVKSYKEITMFLPQPLTTPYCDIPTPLEERGGSSSRHEHLSPILMDEYDDIQAGDSTHHIPIMEAPSPSFIANTWDNINIPCDHVITPLYTWSKEMEFRKGLIFSNKADVQYAAKIYSIERNQRYKVYESNLTQWGINCTNGCSWKLRACQRKKHGLWEITKYSGPHTCTNIDVSKDGKMLDSNLIEREILNQKAIARIYGDWVQSYEILPKFMLALQEANPTTVVKFLKKDGFERNTERFQRVFWAFGPCIAGFVHCRPVISIDGTHLYGKYQGKLLIAMAQDANNEIYPLAFAIVENESESTWKWFLSLIRLHVTQRKGICTISDRHGGIRKAIMDKHVPDWRSPNGHWRFCIRHVASNFLKHTMRKAGKELDEIAVEQWTYSHDGGHRYGAMTTNLSECFNGVLKGARSLPITALVKFTFFKLVSYFDDRRAKIQDQLSSGEVYSKYAMDILLRCREKAKGHTVISYSESFEPMKDEPYWQPIEGPTLRPDPTMLRQKGRPKSTRIRNEMDWRENQPKPRCGICQEEGHNRRTCPNVRSGSTSGTGTN